MSFRRDSEDSFQMNRERQAHSLRIGDDPPRNVLGKDTTPLPSVKKPIRRSYILPRTMVSKLRNARRLSGTFHLPLT